MERRFSEDIIYGGLGLRCQVPAKAKSRPINADIAVGRFSFGVFRVAGSGLQGLPPSSTSSLSPVHGARQGRGAEQRPKRCALLQKPVLEFSSAWREQQDTEGLALASGT